MYVKEGYKVFSARGITVNNATTVDVESVFRDKQMVTRESTLGRAENSRKIPSGRPLIREMFIGCLQGGRARAGLLSFHSSGQRSAGKRGRNAVKARYGDASDINHRRLTIKNILPRAELTYLRRGDTTYSPFMPCV